MLTPSETRAREDEGLFYIVDLRPEWNRNPYVSFWRPNDAGYCYALSWAGKYTAERVAEGGRYYTDKAWTSSKGPGRLFTRFAVRCADIDALGVAPDTEGRGRIDGNAGPVLRQSGAMRNRLRRLRFLPARPLPASLESQKEGAEPRKELSGQSVSLSPFKEQSTNAGATEGEPASSCGDGTPTHGGLAEGER